MYAYEYPNYVMKEERGDLVVGRKFNFRNECRYATEHGIEYNKILKQVIKQEKDWCESCIFQAIRLHNLIDYDVRVSDDMEATVTARLRGVIPPKKLKEMKRQSNEESNK